MTALAGRWNLSGRPDAADSCERMLAAQRMYGPHSASAWDGGEIALARRLFRLLPEDVHDQGPLIGGGGRFILVADCRLDNRQELQDALGISPEEARVAPDAGFILRAWEKWGEDALDRLLGDYAIAVWDGREHRLTLARDPLGNRPLHYHQGDGFFAFASMPKGLHALAEVPYAPDEVRGAEFLAIMPEVGPRSFFEGISRVETGHLLTVNRSRVQSRRHWSPARGKLKLPAGDAVEGMREHLDRAVQARLRGSGGVVGAHLSAGLDSSGVAATAARLLSASGGKVIAFTAVPRAGYDGPVPAGCIGDESDLARSAAAPFSNMETVSVRPSPGTLIDDLDRDFYLYDRPLVNAENQRWWNAINAEAGKRKLSVLLTGVMGNFTISYTGMEAFAEMAASGRWLELLRRGRATVKSGHRRWSRVGAAAIGPWLPEWAWNAAARAGRGWRWDPATYSVLRRERGEELHFPELARERGFDLSYRPRRNGFDLRLWGMRRVDLGNNNKGALAGWGVDLRDPTTDRRLIEFCLSLPSEVYLGDGAPRSFARQVLSDRLPGRILDERRRGLQAADWHEGLTAARSEIASEIERLEQVPAAASALDLPRMRKLLDEWPSDGWDKLETVTRYRMAMLRGVVSGHFLRKASQTNA